MISTIITITLITNVLNFELAVSQAEKEKGMMFRKSWGQIDGMIFINNRPETVSYWMKNTYLPMRMYFLDKEMNILETYFPETLSTDIITSKNTNIMYIIEMNPTLTNLLQSEFNILKPKLKYRLELKENGSN